MPAPHVFPQLPVFPPESGTRLGLGDGGEGRLAKRGRLGEDDRAGDGLLGDLENRRVGVVDQVAQALEDDLAAVRKMQNQVATLNADLRLIGIELDEIVLARRRGDGVGLAGRRRRRPFRLPCCPCRLPERPARGSRARHYPGRDRRSFPNPPWRWSSRRKPLFFPSAPDVAKSVTWTGRVCKK